MASSRRAGAKPKSRYHHGDLRRALIDASIALIEEEGVEALTLRAIARRLGVSHAAPQHHFASKNELLAAVAAEGFEALGQSLARAAEPLDAPLDQLKAAGVAYVRFAAKHPAHFRVMFGPHLRGIKDPQVISDRASSVLMDASRAVAAKAGEPGLAQTISVAAWSLVHGLATLWLDGPLRQALGTTPSPRQLEHLARAITDLVGRALDG